MLHFDTPRLSRIMRTPTGRYRAYIATGRNGKGQEVRHWISATTETEARRRQHAKLAAIQTRLAAPSKITVQAWLDKWLEEICIPRTSPRQIPTIRSQIRKHIIPAVGGYRLQDVGAEEVRELITSMRHNRAGDRTVQTVYGLFSVAMRDAVYDELITRNPCELVPRPKNSPNKRGALTVMEARRVIVTAMEGGDPLASLWAAFLFLGKRRGELIGLEWSRLDLESGMVDISWQLQQLPWSHGPGCDCPPDTWASMCSDKQINTPPGFIMRPLEGARAWTLPKSHNSIATLPLPAPLLFILREYAKRANPNPWGLVWATEDGKPLPERSVTKRWKQALARAGVVERDLHSARHTTGTLLLEAGVSPEIIQQILGHSDVVTTRGYMHVHNGMVQDAMTRLSDLIALPNTTA